MYKRLSYTLNTRDHAFPGAPTLSLAPFDQIAKGDPCNTWQFTLFNHFGTHMDGAYHFNPEGSKLYEMDLSSFIFERPLLIDIPKDAGELVEPDDLLPYEEQILKADALLCRSGFSSMRVSNNHIYSEKGPGVSSRASQLIVDRFQNLKAVVLDWISLSSPLHLEDGILSHQIMLGQTGSFPILIVEDVNLEGIEANAIEMIFALPLFIEGIDSAPVTVVAKLQD